MKKINLILFLTLTLISCNKSNADNNGLIEAVEFEVTDTDNLNKYNNTNPITIEYSNKINGYKVSAYWIIKEYANFHGVERYFVGPATLKFTNEENDEVFYIQHPEYSINISKDNLKKKYTEMKQRINVMFDNSLREITGLAIQPIDTYVESDVTSSSTGVFKVGNVSTVES